MLPIRITVSVGSRAVPVDQRGEARVGGLLAHRLARVAGRHHHPAREQLPEHEGGGIDVRAHRRQVAYDLLGRHVPEGAAQRPGLRRLERERASHLRHREVRELHLSRPRQEDVRRVHVAVDHRRELAGLPAARLVRGSERPKGRMMAVGMHWTYQHEYRSVDDDLRAYEGVTLASVREVLDRYPLDRVTTLALGPLKGLRPAGANGR